MKQYAFSLNWIENGTKLVMSFMRHYLISLSDLHTALRESKVTKVSIDWIKYIIYWRTPGWYTLLELVNGHLQLFDLKVQIYVENE